MSAAPSGSFGDAPALCGVRWWVREVTQLRVGGQRLVAEHGKCGAADPTLLGHPLSTSIVARSSRYSPSCPASVSPDSGLPLGQRVVARTAVPPACAVSRVDVRTRTTRIRRYYCYISKIKVVVGPLDEKPPWDSKSTLGTQRRQPVWRCPGPTRDGATGPQLWRRCRAGRPQSRRGRR